MGKEKQNNKNEANKMTLNEMLNQKLKNEMSLIEEWKVDSDGLVILHF